MIVNACVMIETPSVDVRSNFVGFVMLSKLSGEGVYTVLNVN